MATALGRSPDHDVVFLTANPRPEWKIPGVSKAVFKPQHEPSQDAHPLSKPWDEAVIKAEAAMAAAMQLRGQHNFVPDVIVGHSGWGPTLYLQDVFSAPFISYCEWYYNPWGADAVFGRPHTNQQSLPTVSQLQMRSRNAVILTDLAVCSFAYSPTQWQRAQFPAVYQQTISVRHDGVDTHFFSPSPGERLVLPGLDLSLHPELITFAGRGMEPYRGFPQFMEAVGMVLEQRPACRVAIAGQDRCCYGPPPAPGKTWKDEAMEKLNASGADTSRIHFTGPLPYGHYRRLLRSSSLHVYLTRPFVLSWSMLEAMSCGCLLLASDTEPVSEVVRHEDNGLLTDFFDAEKLARAITDALERQEELQPLRAAARQTVLDRYALAKLLPGHLQMVENAARGKPPEEGLGGSEIRDDDAPRFGPG